MSRDEIIAQAKQWIDEANKTLGEEASQLLLCFGRDDVTYPSSCQASCSEREASHLGIGDNEFGCEWGMIRLDHPDVLGKFRKELYATLKLADEQRQRRMAYEAEKKAEKLGDFRSKHALKAPFVIVPMAEKHVFVRLDRADGWSSHFLTDVWTSGNRKFLNLKGTILFEGTLEECRAFIADIGLFYDDTEEPKSE